MENVKNDDKDSNNKNEMKELLEEQIALMQWIQAFAVFTEAILLTKLYFLNDDSSGERKILAGIWVQTVGQVIESIGVTNQLSKSHEDFIFNSQSLAVAGDSLQSMGAALQAIGGGEILVTDGETIIP